MDFTHRTIAHAHAARRAGKASRARQLYHHIANKQQSSALDHDIASYMLAYLHAMKAIQTHGSLSVVGTDLREPYYDAYAEAGKHLAEINSARFNPDNYRLPLLDSYSLAMIGKTNSEAAFYILSNGSLVSRLTERHWQQLRLAKPRKSKIDTLDQFALTQLHLGNMKVKQLDVEQQAV